MNEELMEKLRGYHLPAQTIGKEETYCDEARANFLNEAIFLISAEARKQERERILDYIDKHWFYSTCTNINGQTMTYRTLLDMDLQSLKEGGKDKERVA